MEWVTKAVGCHTIGGMESSTKQPNSWNILSLICSFCEWILSGDCKFSSVQFNCSVVADSLQPHESQHARPPCPSPTLGVHSDSCPSSQWCHLAISFSVVPFSSCPQSLSAPESSSESTVRMRWPKFQPQHHSFQRTEIKHRFTRALHKEYNLYKIT